MFQDSRIDAKQVWYAVPVYNNKDSVKELVSGCRAILEQVVVVDDGSTDADLGSLLQDLDVTVLKHDRNLGKGKAILTASRYIEKQGGRYMITIDADGQHRPEDIRKFIPMLDESDPALIIGCRNFDTDNVPGKSRFGRKFANFWLKLETGVYVDDCQSGFRAYPVQYLNKLKLLGSHYNFEAEVLAKAAWAGLSLKCVEIEVYYPEPEKRVSSFRPFVDNFRISLVHTMLVLQRLLPLRQKKLVKREKTDLKALLHPVNFLKMLISESATPSGLAVSAAVGIFLAVLPLLFVHTIVILYVATRLNLNKIVAVNVQHLAAPPFVPALCIEIGYYMRNGEWLTELTFETIFAQFSDRLVEWLLGSLVVAPVMAVMLALTVFFTATFIKKRSKANAEKKRK